MSMFNRGILLRINLSDYTIKKEQIDDRILNNYIGGKGVAARILYDEVPADTDPLSEHNKLIFATGPLQGTLIPLTGRHCVYSKSPLTNAICDSYSGGFFAVELKYAGYDYIVIEGKADKPVYIYIYNDTVEIRDARKYWGMDTHVTEDMIREDLGDNKFQISCIGQAGENLVKYASIINNKHNAAARGGLGAVMGSKNLKAIAVKGTKDYSVYDSKLVFDAGLKAREKVRENSGFWNEFTKYGTSLTVEVTNAIGIYPTKNFKTGEFEAVDEIGGNSLLNRMVIGQRACFGCHISCNKSVLIDRGILANRISDRQEYETMFAFGGNCGNENLESIITAGHLCNKYGIDTISTGVTISFMMELYERGIVGLNDTDSIDLRFGNHESIIKIIEKIANRDGIGDLMAEGSKYLANHYDKCSEEYAMHVKGMEIAGYDPRGAKGMALCYATSNRGACHNYSYTIGAEMWTKTVDRFSNEGKAKMNVELQNQTAAVNSVVLCKFPFDNVIWTLDDVAEMLNSVTGYGLSGKDLDKIGERIYNLERMYNYGSGLSRRDDRIPKRFIKEPMPSGPAKGHIVEDFEKMLEEYYSIRGWDTITGTPTKEKLQELGL